MPLKNNKPGNSIQENSLVEVNKLMVTPLKAYRHYSALGESEKSELEIPKVETTVFRAFLVVTELVYLIDQPTVFTAYCFA